MRAGHRRAGGGPDVEDDATGHSSEHGACQPADSEVESTITTQQRSTQHPTFQHDSLGGSSAEGETDGPKCEARCVADPYYDPGGYAGYTQRSHGQGEVTAADAER